MTFSGFDLSLSTTNFPPSGHIFHSQTDRFFKRLSLRCLSSKNSSVFFPFTAAVARQQLTPALARLDPKHVQQSMKRLFIYA